MFPKKPGEKIKGRLDEVIIDHHKADPGIYHEDRLGQFQPPSVAEFLSSVTTIFPLYGKYVTPCFFSSTKTYLQTFVYTKV